MGSLPFALHSCQLHNRILRECGVNPGASYRYRLGPGDVVRMLIVEQEPPTVRRIEATVEEIAEHGWYSDVAVRNGGPAEIVRLFRDGPPDWGAIQCRLVRQVYRPLPLDPTRI